MSTYIYTLELPFLYPIFIPLGHCQLHQKIIFNLFVKYLLLKKMHKYNPK